MYDFSPDVNGNCAKKKAYSLDLLMLIYISLYYFKTPYILINSLVYFRSIVACLHQCSGLKGPLLSALFLLSISGEWSQVAIKKMLPYFILGLL